MDAYGGITCSMGRVVPLAMEEDVVQPLKTLSLDPIIKYNFHPVSNHAFPGKVVERVVRHMTLEQYSHQLPNAQILIIGLSGYCNSSKCEDQL